MRQNKAAMGASGAIGALAGAVGVLAWNPGSITEGELEHLRDGWRVALEARRDFERTAGELDWNLGEGEFNKARELWDELAPAWHALDDELDRFARDFWDFYRFDEVEVGALEGTEENPVVELVRRARAAWDGEHDPLIIQLPAGELPAFLLGTRDRAATVDCRFLGDATLVLQGHPAGTAIMPEHDLRGWGTTIGLQTDGEAWEGRVHLRDLVIYASGGNALATYSRFGDPDSRTPYHDVRLERCAILDHPNGVVDVVRPISVNHAALSIVECVFDLPRSREHAWYVRNPFNAPQEILDNVVLAVGGQVGQYASRPAEGPSYGRSSVTVRGNTFAGYGRHCSRAATAWTVGGSGQDFTLVGNVFHDLEPSGCFGPGRTGGSVVVWNGGTHYTLEGEAIGGTPTSPDRPPPEGSYANGRIELRGNVFVQKDPDRPTVSLQSAESALVLENAILGRDCLALRAWDVHAGALGAMDWRENNRPEDLEHALEAVPMAPLDAADAWLRVDGAPEIRLTESVVW